MTDQINYLTNDLRTAQITLHCFCFSRYWKPFIGFSKPEISN